ncbi:MAG: hypothetical protein AAGJ35_10920, partial [Myxococcota bacterium]
AHIAGHAYILGYLGQTQQAFDLLCDVMRFSKHFGYLTWLMHWLHEEQPLQLSALFSMMAEELLHTVGILFPRASESHVLLPMVGLIRSMQDFPWLEQQPLFFELSSAVMRRVHAYEDAVSLAQKACVQTDSTRAYVALGLAYRQQKRYDAAEEAFVYAYQRAPEYHVHLLEVVRTLWDAKDFKRALEVTEVYRVTMEKEDPAFSDPELDLYQMFFRHQLYQRIEDSPCIDLLGASATADQSQQLWSCCVGHLPPPHESSLRPFLRRMHRLSRMDSFSSSTHGISSTQPDAQLYAVEQPALLEPPSLHLVHLSMGTSQGAEYYANCTLPEPDPRRAKQTLQYKLWAFDADSVPLPQFQCPSPHIAALVEKLAALPYFLPRWWRCAQEYAKPLTSNDLPCLLACMIAPSDVQTSFAAYTWRRHLQIASALLIAQLPTEWEDSMKRQALFDVLRGPIDWCTDAAVIALTEIA